MSTLKAIHRGLFDPGWLFLLAGMAALAAAALIPAQDRLDEIRWQVARMEAVEASHQERLDRYQRYLEALEAEDPALARSLAASQLNLAPEDRVPLAPGVGLPSASVFEGLEPGPTQVPVREVRVSRLHSLATGRKTRPWMLAGGMLAVAIGLMPRTEARRAEDEGE